MTLLGPVFISNPPTETPKDQKGRVHVNIRHTWLDSMGENVARLLGPAWCVDPTYQKGYFTVVLRPNKEERDFGIRLNMTCKDRLKVTGTGAIATDGTIFSGREREKPPSITVDANQPPVVIVRAIKRRFLGKYTAALEQAVRDRDAHNQYLEEQKARIKTVADALGGSIRGEQIFVSMAQFGFDKYGYVGRCQVDSTVTIEFRSMPVDVALKVIQAWKSEMGGPEKKSSTEH